MSYVERHQVAITTATGGGATVHTPVLTGRIANVILHSTGANAFVTGTDVAVTAEETDLNIWTESNVGAAKTVAPVQVANSVSGVVLNTAGDDRRTPIFVANERVQIAVTNGGNTKSGTCTVVVA